LDEGKSLRLVCDGIDWVLMIRERNTLA